METRAVNGQLVRRYSNGAWYYEGSGVTPGASGAREVDGAWFYVGSGVATPQDTPEAMNVRVVPMDPAMVLAEAEAILRGAS